MPILPVYAVENRLNFSNAKTTFWEFLRLITARCPVCICILNMLPPLPVRGLCLNYVTLVEGIGEGLSRDRYVTVPT